METIRDRTFLAETVSLDDREFIGCHLQDCELRYSGGEFLLKDTSINGCKWSFGGCALRTLVLSRTFDLHIGSEFRDLSAEFSPMTLWH